MFSSIGAFPTVEASGALGDHRAQVALLASTWKSPAPGVTQNSFGLTYRPRSTETVRYDLTLGWSQPSAGATSDEGTIVGGAGAVGPLWRTHDESGIGLDWKLSVGGGHSGANGGTEYWSVVGQLPLRMNLEIGASSVLSAFASGGYGVGGVGDYADAEFGMRPLVAFGGSFQSGAGFAVQVGAQQVMQDIEGAKPPWVLGLSLSFPLGERR